MLQRICIDREIDELMNKQGASMGPPCKKHEVNVSGLIVTVRSVCDFGKSQLTSTSTTTFKGETAYHSDVRGRFDPPMGGISETVSVQDAKWTGACPANMRPGQGVVKTPQGGEVPIDLRAALKH